jgi:hypothetical protein
VFLSGRWAARYHEAVLTLSAYWREWVRPPDRWEPSGSSPGDQFASLARHFFALYDVPRFLDAAWHLGLTAEGVRQQAWFRHVGRGASIRTADGLPIPLTRRMAHFFMQAPPDMPVLRAFRYAQVLGIGGPEPLARSLAGTRIGDDFGHDDFWVTVARWLIDHPEVDAVHHGPVIDFLHDQRYVPSLLNPLIHVPRQPELVPPWPCLSVKGRTPASLLRAVGDWHKSSFSRLRPVTGDWRRSGLPPFRLEVTGGSGPAVYTTTELLTAWELAEEGRALKHCVGTYASLCLLGRSSIWSLSRADGSGKRERLLTLQVDNATRQLIQARGEGNRAPTAGEVQVLDAWARAGGPGAASFLAEPR